MPAILSPLLAQLDVAGELVREDRTMIYAI